MTYVKSLDINNFDYEKIREKMISRKKELDDMMNLEEHTAKQKNFIKTVSAMKQVARNNRVINTNDIVVTEI